MAISLEFLTGAAGTGKSFELRRRVTEAKGKGGRQYACLTATTGIAAINLSGNSGETVCTINSQLGFFDTASLQEAYRNKRLHRNLRYISKAYRMLSVDEISMMGKDPLDIIYQAVMDVNESAEVANRGGLGMLLVGDFMQLPPVKDEFAFNAQCWNKFKVTKLDKVWRQDHAEFLRMLNAARSGDGELVSKMMFRVEGIKVSGRVDMNFDGTTIVAVNRLVDEINEKRLAELLKDPANALYEFPTYRWGKQRSEWKQVPETVIACKNAYVMILANDSPKFSYANGSCGYIRSAEDKQGNGTVWVQKKDNGIEVRVRKVTRKNYTTEVPEGCYAPEKWLSKSEWSKRWKEESEKEESEYEQSILGHVIGDSVDLRGDGSRNQIVSPLSTLVIANPTEVTDAVTEELGDVDLGDKEALYKAYLIQLTASLRVPNSPYFDFLEEKWVIGEVTYTPIRLAYASTVHKTQGLSLDAVQIDFSHDFFGDPSMAYVALSRVRTPEGLTVVGNRKLFEDRCNISSEVVRWI